ncbi:HD domain-containing protein, partial [Tumebacillus flagellatus]|uniref:HD domain-containing protein n=1 Tax=Tumebacillus flagellatus TaxID=1157490 RepID=UPI000570AF6C
MDMERLQKQIHFIVEIDAGDVTPYDEAGQVGKYDRELAAAQRLFGLLPEDQRDEMIDLWQEFEERKTPDSQFACALDRLAPLLMNYHTEGVVWQTHGITLDKVLDRNAHIGHGSERLWAFAQEFIRDSVEKGYLPA